MKKGILIFLLLSLFVFITACNSEQAPQESTAPTVQTATIASTAVKETAPPTVAPTEQAATQNTVTEPAPTEAEPEYPQNNNEQPDYSEEQPQDDQNGALQMVIDGTTVSVAWEDNEAVASLEELCKDQSLTIDTSMYGGFEQVGSIGVYLPQNDVQTTTSAGDIVLYSGNQIVVFYGSNTWAYTRLGHITDKTPEELTQLLSNDNVTITLTY